MKIKSKFFAATLGLLFATLPQFVHGGLIQITGTSASAGQLGWFVVDDSIFVTDTSLTASQYYDFSFADPTSSIVVNSSNVDADTGVTYFGYISSVWTVVGGGGDSLTTTDGNSVYIAGDSIAWFRIGGGLFYDVSWSTTAYVESVPDTGGTIALLGIASFALLGLRRRSVN